MSPERAGLNDPTAGMPDDGERKGSRPAVRAGVGERMPSVFPRVHYRSRIAPIQFAGGNLGSIRPTTFGYQTSEAIGWTIVASSSGTQFTNDRSVPQGGCWSRSGTKVASPLLSGYSYVRCPGLG